MKKRTLLLCFFSLLFLFSACSSQKTDLLPVELPARNSATDSELQGDVIAVACGVNAPIGGIEFSCKITGESPQITVAIYKAEKDYQTTLSGKPVRKETVTDLTERLLWQFRTLPAGNYLVVFSRAKDATLIKSVIPSDASNGKTVHYRNGEVMTDGTCALTLLCVKTTENPEPAMTTFFYPVVEE